MRYYVNMNKYDTNSSTSYTLGLSLTIEALLYKAEYVKEVILSNKVNDNKQLQLLKNLCNENNIPIHIDDKIINQLSIKENCYGIGIFDKYYESLKSDNHLLLYQFNDYGQLGTTLRSAISFNQKDIVLIDSDIDYFNPACVRSSMGSIFQANIIRYNSLKEYIDNYPNNRLYTLNDNADIELSDLNIKYPYSILLSYQQIENEFIDKYFYIERNKKDISLAVSSAIILERIYHLNLNR